MKKEVRYYGKKSNLFYPVEIGVLKLEKFENWKILAEKVGGKDMNDEVIEIVREYFIRNNESYPVLWLLEGRFESDEVETFSVAFLLERVTHNPERLAQEIHQYAHDCGVALLSSFFLDLCRKIQESGENLFEFLEYIGKYTEHSH